MTKIRFLVKKKVKLSYLPALLLKNYIIPTSSFEHGCHCPLPSVVDRQLDAPLIARCSSCYLLFGHLFSSWRSHISDDSIQGMEMEQSFQFSQECCLLASSVRSAASLPVQPGVLPPCKFSQECCLLANSVWSTASLPVFRCKDEIYL